ncbi:MAG: hypothetical protein ABSG99_02730 [Sedimentisphaerales bacterium]
MIQHPTYAVPRMDLGEAFHEYDPSVDGFIATQVLPALPVAKEAATMSVITRENLKRADAKHSNGAAFNRINLISEDKAYACEDYGLEIQLTDKDRAKYRDDYDAEIESSQALAKKIFNELEIRVATAVFNTTTWATGTAALYTDNKATPWSTTTTDPIIQVAAAKEKVRVNSGVRADALIIGEPALNHLLANTVIRARFPGVAVISEAMLRANLAAIFGLTDLIVGGAVYDSAKEGQVFTGADIWDYKYAMVAKIQRGPTRVNPGIGRVMTWEELTDAADIAPVLQYREEQTVSDIFRIQQYLDELIFDAYFGHLMRIET